MAVSVLLFLLAGPCLGAIEAFPGHTHLLFILKYPGSIYKFDPIVDKLNV